MQVGMVVSNEPGYYEDGAFGIRIENLLITKEADTPFRYAGQTYMCFEPLTFCPIQRKMLALKVLTLLQLHCTVLIAFASQESLALRRYPKPAAVTVCDLGCEDECMCEQPMPM